MKGAKKSARSIAPQFIWCFIANSPFHSREIHKVRINRVLFNVTRSLAIRLTHYPSIDTAELLLPLPHLRLNTLAVLGTDPPVLTYGMMGQPNQAGHRQRWQWEVTVTASRWHRPRRRSQAAVGTYKHIIAAIYIRYLLLLLSLC